jgi:outer membrane protein assembly factor BamE (lipoprotein component of BamABCDE complex)
MRAFLALSLAALASACTPVVSERGYLPEQNVLDTIQVGQDTKTSVTEKLGNPSTESDYGSETWYYISSHQEQIAFNVPETTSQRVVAIEYNPAGQVANIHKFTLEDGHIVDLVSRETPARGRELTILQQLFYSSPGVGAAAPNTGGGGPGN